MDTDQSSGLTHDAIDVVATPVHHAVAVFEVPKVTHATSRQKYAGRTPRHPPEVPSRTQEYAGTDVHATMLAECVAHHVDGLEFKPLDAPLRMHLDLERLLEEPGQASRRHLEVLLGFPDQKNVVHIEQEMGDKPSGLRLAVAAVTFRRQFALAEVVGWRQIVVGEPLAEVAAYVEPVIPLILVYEMIDQPKKLWVPHIFGEHGLQGAPVYRRIVFADVELDEVFAVTLPRPPLDGSAGVDGSPAGDARGLPPSNLGVEHRLQRRDGDIIIYLVAYCLSAYDPVLTADGFDAIEVPDLRMTKSAVAYLRGNLLGQRFEVRVLLQKPLDVAP